LSKGTRRSELEVNLSGIGVANTGIGNVGSLSTGNIAALCDVYDIGDCSRIAHSARFFGLRLARPDAQDRRTDRTEQKG